MAKDSPSQSSTIGSSVSAIRDATKWIIASTAAVGALLVARLGAAGLAGFADPSTHLAWFLAGFAAIAVALIAIYQIIASGAAVLVGQTVSLSDLLEKEVEAEEMATKQGAPFDKSGVLPRARVMQLDPVLQRIYSQREVLFRGTSAHSPAELRDLLNQAHHALREINSGQSVMIDDNLYPPTPEGRTAVSERIVRLETAERRLVESVATDVSRSSFDQLKRRLRSGVAILVGALVVVAFAADQGRPSPDVSSPTLVEVFLANTDVEMPDVCFGDEGRRAGTAVSGSWSEPWIAFPPTDDCPAQHIRLDNSVYVVVPATGE